MRIRKLNDPDNKKNSLGVEVKANLIQTSEAGISGPNPGIPHNLRIV